MAFLQHDNKGHLSRVVSRVYVNLLRKSLSLESESIAGLLFISNLLGFEEDTQMLLKIYNDKIKSPAMDISRRSIESLAWEFIWLSSVIDREEIKTPFTKSLLARLSIWNQLKISSRFSLILALLMDSERSNDLALGESYKETESPLTNLQLSTFQKSERETLLAGPRMDKTVWSEKNQLRIGDELIYTFDVLTSGAKVSRIYIPLPAMTEPETVRMLKNGELFEEFEYLNDKRLLLIPDFPANSSNSFEVLLPIKFDGEFNLPTVILELEGSDLLQAMDIAGRVRVGD